VTPIPPSRLRGKIGRERGRNGSTGRGRGGKGIERKGRG